MSSSRREFLRSAAGFGAGVLVSGCGASAQAQSPAPVGPAILSGRAALPVVIASSNGLPAVTEAAHVLAEGGDTLAAVVRGVNIVEEDPEDMSVGYGGLPNLEGIVQLDSSVMHGPTRGAGAVASLEGVRTPSKVAVAVMRYTDHVLLVGEGAQRFARQMGFRIYPNDEMLPEATRLVWLRWRARLSDRDNYLLPGESGERLEHFQTEADRPPASLPPPENALLSPADALKGGLRDSHDGQRPMGTIHCSGVNTRGEISGVTTTSGLAYKLPGRVGDSPIVGAGLYTDNDVGSAGSTGRGEAAIKTCGSHTVVMLMAMGRSPTDACLEACRQVVRWTVEPRLLAPDGRPNFNINFYAVNKRGEHGAAAIWSGARYAVHVSGTATLRDSAYLFEEK